MALGTVLDLRIKGDDRGSLIALEAVDVGFEVKRVYYIFETKDGVARGFHAHRNLEQVAVAVAGSCTMTLDDGFERRDIVLDNPAKGLRIGSLIWREMTHFSPDCVLLVLASASYDTSDYIRDYEEFLVAARSARLAENAS